MVDPRGFEPLTPCMPCRCATRLRHGPKRTFQDYYTTAGARAGLLRHETSRRESVAEPINTVNWALSPITGQWPIVLGVLLTVVPVTPVMTYPGMPLVTRAQAVAVPLTGSASGIAGQSFQRRSSE
jgi:hypothetical protein